MNKLTIVNEINHYLALFTLEVEQFNSASLYDINIHAENTVIPLLNQIYGIDLVNINLFEKNFPAVDLVDYSNRIAFQVTAADDSEKITYTITKFIEHKLYESFDSLYVYILTKKLDYRKDFQALTQGHFEFDKNEHVIDNISLFRQISNKPILFLNKVKDHLALEFSPEKLRERADLLNREIIEIPAEDYILNLIKISIPEQMFVAPLSLKGNIGDIEKGIEAERKSKKFFRRRKGVSQREILKKLLRDQEKGFCNDWILYNNNLLTFRNLNNSSELLRDFIDTGSIDMIKPTDFYLRTDDTMKVFKSLIGFSLRERFHKIGIEWLEKRKIYRFRASPSLAPVKVKWKKDKKHAHRAVFDEVWNEEETHITSFRHLAFSITEEIFDEQWYISVKPSWSFTHNGRNASSFESSSIKKMKLLENNAAVHNHTRFIADYLSKDPDIELLKIQELAEINKEDISYEILISSRPIIFEYKPAIKDADWLPPKADKKS